jgi:hypothetical protein
MADNNTVAYIQQTIQLSDESSGPLRLASAAFTNPNTGYTEITILRVDPVVGAAIMVGTFQVTSADWTTLQGLFTSLTQAPLN